jgi:hypothetical protein
VLGRVILVLYLQKNFTPFFHVLPPWKFLKSINAVYSIGKMGFKTQKHMIKIVYF